MARIRVRDLETLEVGTPIRLALPRLGWKDLSSWITGAVVGSSPDVVTRAGEVVLFGGLVDTGLYRFVRVLDGLGQCLYWATPTGEALDPTEIDFEVVE